MPCGMAPSSCRSMLAGWTIGGAGYCLQDQVGVEFGPNKYQYMALQVHWNNPELRNDYSGELNTKS